LGWGGVYDKRFLRPSKQVLRARLNGGLLSLRGFVIIWMVGMIHRGIEIPPPWVVRCFSRGSGGLFECLGRFGRVGGVCRLRREFGYQEA